MAQGDAQLIGVDWGTSALRAYLLAEGGRVLDARTRPWGILSTPDGDFGAAFHAVVGDWHSADPGLPAIASGMIGSTEGWARAPYCSCPAGPQELAAALVDVATASDGVLHVIPGVDLTGTAPNVMRGEETQVAGALALQPALHDDALLVLPGTHSKWVEIHAGRIVRFDTYMTGELYASLSEHSILARPARKAAADARERGELETGTAWEAFGRGVGMTRENGERGVAPLLFLTRSLVLQGALRAEESLDFLSGLLIGDELRSALGSGTRRLALVGTAALCARYERALALFGFPGTPVLDETAPAGLWDIARQAGLIPSTLLRR